MDDGGGGSIGCWLQEVMGGGEGEVEQSAPPPWPSSAPQEEDMDELLARVGSWSTDLWEFCIPESTGQLFDLWGGVLFFLSFFFSLSPSLPHN